MGASADVVIFGVAGADAVNSLQQGLDPVGYAGSVISVAANAGQLAVSATESLGVAAPSIETVASITRVAGGASAAGAGLTAVQVKLDLDSGKDIKVGDLVTVGTAIPVGLAVAVGAISTGSILVPIAAVLGLAGAIANLFGFTLSDIFAKLQETSSGRELTPAELNAIDRFLGSGLFDFNTSNYSIDLQCSRYWDTAQRWRPLKDPLILDLDGDGLETIGSSSPNPILFDHDGDGIKNGTGWIRPDDGFLVLDRNGNGVIDNGTELFGDSTPLYTGGKAEDGFAALAQEDTNGDGFVNDGDARWNDLRVWRDLNQDGISQLDELFALDQVGVASFTVIKTEHSQILPSGNEIADFGSYTRLDGSSGVLGEVGKLADVNLLDDTFHREFPDSLPISEDVAALPNMRGSGKVRDLREAASQSAILKDLLVQYTYASTKEAQLTLMEDMLEAWADTSGMVKTFRERASGTYIVSYKELGADKESLITVGVPGEEPSDPNTSSGIEGITPEWAATIAKWERQTHILEAFNGRYLFQLPTEDADAAPMSGITFVPPDEVGSGSGVFSPPKVVIKLSRDQIGLLDQSYQALQQSIYSALLLQTRFKPVLDEIDLAVDATGIKLDFARVEQDFASRIAVNAANGLNDLIEFTKAADSMLGRSSWNGLGLLENYIRTLPVTPDLRAVYAEYGVLLAGQANFSNVGSKKDDIIVSANSSDDIDGAAGNDIIFASAGDDTLHGGLGNDILDGGAGNDRLDGNEGNDVYLFGKGDGQDIISARDVNFSRTDILRFKAGVAPSELEFRRSAGFFNTDLEISIVGTTDKITVNGFFTDDNPYGNEWAIQRIEFADGTAWDISAIVQKVFSGTAGNDEIRGTAFQDAINGGTGNDSLDGAAGNDIVNGGTGNDTLSGGTGNDTLDGGAGNDRLDGNEGNDVYLFGKGDGQDIISARDVNFSRSDILRFKAGVAPSELELRRSAGFFNTDLEISIVGTTDKITVNGFFTDDNPYGNEWAIQRIEFADGTAWDIPAIVQKVFSGTAGNDEIRGSAFQDAINGGTGNDTLDGAAGNDIVNGGIGNDTLSGGTDNDTLDGGAGNDRLDGNEGSDVYLFGKGDGQDIIAARDISAGRSDTLRFKAGVAPSDLELRRSPGFFNTDLEISIVGTTDKITVSGFFIDDNPYGSEYAVQRIEFADGTAWDIPAIVQKVFSGTVGNDEIRGTAFQDVINGGLGNDTLDGAGGNDTVNGGIGNDNLSGGTDNDTLDGGAGNDYLNGNEGNDVYLFGKGDGQDVILSRDIGAGHLDTLRFKTGVAVSDVVVRRINDDLELSIAGTSDKITVSGYFIGNNPATSEYAIQRVEFANGTVWSQADLLPRLLGGTAGNDNLVGTINADAISGLGGDDSLSGGDGNDVLDGGGGNDTLAGDAGNDILDGGTGNDNLNGGVGNDVYLFGRGDGQDVILARETNFSRTDVLRFKDGIAPSDIELHRSSGFFNGDLNISILGTTDKITVSGFFTDDNPYGNEWAIQRMEFADGTTWDVSGILSKLFAGTAGNDEIRGTAFQDAINGGVGDDSLDGAAGNDIIKGGTGNDTLGGNEGSDTLDGGAGNDRLNGNEGNDVYLFGKGDGQDIISARDVNFSRTDILRFKAGVAPSELELRRSSGFFNTDLEISIVGTTDKITINGFFTDDNPYGNEWAIQRVEFADGTAWDLSTIVQKVFSGTAGGDEIRGTAFQDAINGGTGNDVLDGAAGNDIVNGGIGNDTLSGGTGNDTLDGGAGNDRLDGNEGSDVYLFGKGDGQDVILSRDVTVGRVETLRFKAGVVASEVIGKRIGDDLVFSVVGTTDQITVGLFYDNNNPATSLYSIQRVEFADGTAYTQSQIMAAVTAGTPLNPSIIGSEGADTLNGTAGADTIFGRGGNDVLNGLDGNDKLNGESGNDTLNGGLGTDTLTGSSGDDTYIVDNVADVVVENASEGIDVVQSSVSYTLGTYVENLVLTGSVSINGTGNGLDNLLVGNSAANVLNGDVGNDTLSGGLGSDTLNGGAGSDRYVFNIGDGVDVVNDVYEPGAANQIVFGAGIDRNSLQFDRSTNALTIRYSANDAITLPNFDFLGAGGTPVIATVAFADGSVLSLAELLNRAPQSSALILDQQTNEDAAYRFQIPETAFTDADQGDVLSFSVALADGSNLPAWLTFDAASRTFAGTPQNGDVGVLSLNVTAVDRFGKAASQTFHLNVSNVNDAPFVADSIPDQQATEDAPFSYTIQADAFDDVDAGDVLVLSATLSNGDPLPGWLTFGTVTRTFSGTPGNGDVGTVSVKVTGTDASGTSASDVFDLQVINVNDAPVVANAIVDQSANEDGVLTFVLPADAFADVDVGDRLVLTATLASGDPLPTWLNFDAATRTFGGIPGNDDVGSISVRVTGTDNAGASASDVFNLSVVNSNDAPAVANAMADQSANEDAPFSFTVPANLFADVDVGDSLALTATMINGDPLPAWLTFDAATGTFSGIPNNGDVGILSVRVTGTDRAGASTSDVFDLQVVNTNDAPIIESGILDETANEDAAFSFTVPANAFADVDVGDSLALTAMLANGDPLPTWLTFNAATGTFSGVPENGDVGFLAVKVTGTDRAGASVSDVFNIGVINTNDAPVVVATMADQAAQEEVAFSVALPAHMFVDADLGDSLAVTATLSNGNSLPSWLTFNSATGVFSGTPATGSVGTLSIKVQATDNAGASASNVFQIAIAAVGTVIGTTVGDNLLGATGRDQLYGLTGDDTLDGGAGNDTLVGGAGTDVLQGGIGNDTYLYQLGGGLDVITDTSGIDTLQFGSGLTLDNLALRILTVNGRQTAQIRVLDADGSELPDQGIDIAVTSDINSQIVSPIEQFVLFGGQQVTLNDLLIKQVSASGGNGGDVMSGSRNDDTLSGFNGNDTLSGGTGNDYLSGANGTDVLYGGGGNDSIYAGNDNDYVCGDAGNDWLWGEGGNDVLQGGSGSDVIDAGNGNDLIEAGSGRDTLYGGNGSQWFAGGTGDDLINAGSLRNLFAVNRGDGADVVQNSLGGKDTISIGKGIKYADLTLSKSGNDLVLGMGQGDAVTLKDWYLDLNHHGVGRLQAVTVGGDYDAASTDKTRNRQVEIFDFARIVSAFDAVRAASPSIDQWAIMGNLLNAHLSGTDTAAIGGDLSYQYAIAGGLAGIGLGKAQDVLASSSFNSTTPQALRSRAELEQGAVKLG